nr:MAG TPA: hypothetical protein [Caudoviricetes sp.]DAQ40749.1 MAG TPA: hypothetical protein [Caudoviricetes sp.]
MLNIHRQTLVRTLNYKALALIAKSLCVVQSTTR